MGVAKPQITVALKDYQNKDSKFYENTDYATETKMGATTGATIKLVGSIDAQIMMANNVHCVTAGEF